MKELGYMLYASIHVYACMYVCMYVYLEALPVFPELKYVHSVTNNADLVLPYLSDNMRTPLLGRR